MPKSVSDILFIEAGQLLPNILICGVQSSVNFLQVERKKEKHKELLISNMRFDQFVNSEITHEQMNMTL